MSISVREIISELKKNIEILLDLAFSAVSFYNPEISSEARKIEKSIHTLNYKLNSRLIQANFMSDREARSVEPIVVFGYSVDKIADALADIASTVSLANLTDIYAFIWKFIPEPIAKLLINEKCPYLNQNFDKMHFRATFNADIVALIRNDRIILDQKFKITKGDKFLIRSDIETLEWIKKEFNDETSFIKVKKFEKDGSDASKKAESLAELIKHDYISMYVMTETMVELAFASILFSNKDIAADVIEMEEKMDRDNLNFERKLLKQIKNIEEPDNLVGLLRIVYCLENISDACANIAEIVKEGANTHPIFSLAFSQSSEVIIKESIKKDSPVIGKALEFVEEPEVSGAFEVMAIYRNNDWLYNLPDDFIFQINDVLIAQGPKESEERWRKLLNPRYPDEEENEEEYSKEQNN